MLTATYVQRISASCPVCRSFEFVEYRRMPAARAGYVIALCMCRRCGLSFTQEEDSRGRPIRR